MILKIVIFFFSYTELRVEFRDRFDIREIDGGLSTCVVQSVIVLFSFISQTLNLIVFTPTVV